MAGKKKRPESRKQRGSPELNIMPFIDIFSMLNTFLLVSASFIGLGILEVQVPFLSNSPEVKEEPDRSFSIRVDIEEAQVILTTQYTMDPVEKKVENYKIDETDLAKFHAEMIRIRQSVPDADKVTVYSDDEVKYDSLVLVIDAIKTLGEKEPPLTVQKTDEDGNVQQVTLTGGREVFSKVVMGSVIL